MSVSTYMSRRQVLIGATATALAATPGILPAMPSTFFKGLSTYERMR